MRGWDFQLGNEFNRPGLVGCENAWDRYATSQQPAGPEKGDVGKSRVEATRLQRL